MNTPLQPICLPPAPSNGGDLAHAPAKIGDWVWQPKVDDWRCVIHAPTSTVWNQYGKLSSVAAQNKLKAALWQLRSIDIACAGLEWLDAGIMENRHDMMRGSIVVFDVMTADGDYDERRAVLASVLEPLPWATDLDAINSRDKVYLVNDWYGDPLQFWYTLKHQNAKLGRKFYEGCVAKRVAAGYPMTGFNPKTVTPHWVKHRHDQDALDPLAPFRTLNGVATMAGLEVA